MFKRKTKKTLPLRIDTLIGVGAMIEGDVRFKGGLHVDGRIKGNVVAEANAEASLSISNSGLIEGVVRVPNVILHGRIQGDLIAAQRVELGSTAQVSGNVHYGMIEMALGAQINGKLIHGGMEATAPAAAEVVAAPSAPAADAPKT